MLNQDVPVIVRILALPCHSDCCHIPALRSLARMNTPNLTVSLRGQYCPEWKITAKDGVMSRRVSAEELNHLVAAATRWGNCLNPAH